MADPADPKIPATDDERRSGRTQQARDAYDEARRKVREARTPSGGTPNHYEYFVQDVTAAAVELMLSGLEEWLAAGAKDRASAEKDRRDQKYARWVMIGLTIAIIVVGVLGYRRPVAPIIVPAPVVNIPAPVVNVAAPVVNIAPIPVTVTLPPPATHRARAVTK